ncbi:hypothetical protein FACS189490_06250 [Clostridia bacterium]|nr:hypothetical protein FACS189490_06250 [Clostridia bacterium]
MKILVICDDFYHHSDTIKEGLEFLNTNHTVEINENALSLNPSTFSDYDVITLAKDNLNNRDDATSFLTDEFLDALTAFVESGKGLLILHAGTVCEKTPRLKALIGCAFVQHPTQLPVTFAVTAQNAITSGVSDFTETDEHYFIDLVANDAEIFLESRSVHGEQPSGYVRNYGKGHVAVLLPGHNVPVFKNANYAKLIENTLNYIGGING